MTAITAIVPDHKNWFTGKVETANTFQRAGMAVCRHTQKISDWLTTTRKNLTNSPPIIDTSMRAGTVIGLAIGSVAGIKLAWDIGHNDWSSFAKFTSAGSVVGLMPIVGALFGTVFGGFVGVGAGGVVALYSGLSATTGYALRGTGDLYSAARAPFRPTNLSAAPVDQTKTPGN